MRSAISETLVADDRTRAALPMRSKIKAQPQGMVKLKEKP